MAQNDDPEAVARMGFMLDLRRRGIGDANILRAMDDIPRYRFVDPDFQDNAYEDVALPISCGQTISQPTVVAMMTEMLALSPHHRVLEIGTGSGYQAAILSRLAQEVVSVERWRTLAEAAQQRFADLGIANVTVVVGDGAMGWPELAPYDRIIVTAACERIPPALFEQLREGGLLVAPVGPLEGTQRLVRVRKTAEGLKEDSWSAVRFVPLRPGVAKEL